MAAPDTSFQPTPPSEEGHPGLELREHPVSPRVNSYPKEIQETQRLALDANPLEVLDARADRGA